MKGKLIVVLVLLCAHMGITGGILTNTNQSAQFIRTLSRNAATDIDAVYYNPAGTSALSEGLHIALYNQTIFQEKTVNNSYPLLAQHEFVGEVNVPFFPNLYAVYKMDDLAVSVGFGPNAGGGSAEYSAGLPSFEMGIANLPPMISAMGIPTSGYKADLNFSGSSVYYGVQGNVAYKVDDMISVAVGARYIYAVNTYEGAISNIQINPMNPALGMNGNYMSAVQFFQALSSVNPAAEAYVSMVSDASVDVKQTGSGITPLVGVNVKIDNLNIGLKYEMNTKLELTNETTEDGTGTFPDGATFRNDIPAILGVGAEYAFVPQFRGAFSFTYYFDKNADWEGREDLVDSNFFEAALGLEYDLTETFGLSAGVLHSETGATELYQTDLSHSLTSNTVGLGLRYSFSPALDFDLGGLYTFYNEGEKNYSSNNMPVLETYSRSNYAIALGLGYHF